MQKNVDFPFVIGYKKKMERNTKHLIVLAERFAEESGEALSSVSLYASGSGGTINRLRRGGDVMSRTYLRIIQWFSDHWPLRLDWPADIPRPDPAPDSPAVKALMARFGAPEPGAALTALDAHGRIADVEAFLDALTGGICPILRPTYDQVVAQYADGKPKATAWPRRNSNARKVLDALTAAGDVRFAERAALMRRVFGDAA